MWSLAQRGKCSSPSLSLTTFVLLAGVVALAQCNEASEYFSSVTGLEQLLRTEEVLLLDFRRYIALTKQQINTLQIEIDRIENEHIIAYVDKENYLTNPVNAYRLIKRLHTDWRTYEELIRQDTEDFLEHLTQNKATLSFPGKEDVDGSAYALVRLQETYQLEVKQLAAGILNGVKYGTDMTWHDCFVLGQQLFALENYNHTKAWLTESMQRFGRETYQMESVSLDYLENMAESLFQLGDLESSLGIVNQVLNYDPQRVKAEDIRQTVESSLEQLDVSTLTNKAHPYHQTEVYKTYEKVCRGEVTPAAAQLRPLRCRYVTNNIAYRLLAPFKVEEHSLEPLVLTFHDFIVDTRIDTLQQMAMPYIKRSTVGALHGEELTTASYRISKHAWLPYHTHHYMQDMLRDLHDMTGLDMSQSEQLQVANYGLGGFYAPHWDFFLRETEFMAHEGNRISTAIFYFSDVEQGGATAFPFLQFAVKPKKGNVLFWYNLHPSGDRDYRTKHAGCPVLKGSKWIANVWTHERSQMFTRPCHLTSDHETSINYRYDK